MSDTVTELRIMARKLAQGSIVTKALGQYIFQIMSAVNDDTIQPLRDEIERLRAESATLRQQLAEARAHALDEARAHALDEAAKVTERMLVYADTTSQADVEITAAIRALKDDAP